jgi:hypothetical protein
MAKLRTPPVAETYAALDDLYARIPKMECRGKCQGACTVIEMTTAERQRITAAGVTIPHAFSQINGVDGIPSCPALTMFGQCSVYAVRPIVCRIWGAIESMSCSYGCRPEGGYLPEQWGMALMLLVGAVGEGRSMSVDDALAQTAYLADPVVLKAWMNMQAAGSNPYSENLRQHTREVFAGTLARYKREGEVS